MQFSLLHLVMHKILKLLKFIPISVIFLTFDSSFFLKNIQLNISKIFQIDFSVGKQCNAAIPTISNVRHCPMTKQDHQIAAHRKSCDYLANVQNCVGPTEFVYHCMLNEDKTQLIEVCASKWNLLGKIWNG